MHSPFVYSCRNFELLKACTENPDFKFPEGFIFKFIRKLYSFDRDQYCEAFSFLLSHPDIDLDYRVINNI